MYLSTFPETQTRCIPNSWSQDLFRWVPQIPTSILAMLNTWRRLIEAEVEGKEKVISTSYLSKGDKNTQPYEHITRAHPRPCAGEKSWSLEFPSCTDTPLLMCVRVHWNHLHYRAKMALLMGIVFSPHQVCRVCKKVENQSLRVYKMQIVVLQTGALSRTGSSKCFLWR